MATHKTLRPENLAPKTFRKFHVKFSVELLLKYFRQRHLDIRIRIRICILYLLAPPLGVLSSCLHLFPPLSLCLFPRACARLRIQFNFYLYLFSFSLTICSGCKNFVRFLTTCEAKRKKQQSEREVEGNACCTAAAAPVAVVAVHLIIATVAV